MERPELSDLVLVRWRDSFETEQSTVAKLEEDCTWFTVGWVIRTTDLFLSIAASVQETKLDGEEIDHHVSIPWTQVLSCEVLA
jgi:hypothetical protein